LNNDNEKELPKQAIQMTFLVEYDGCDILNHLSACFTDAGKLKESMVYSKIPSALCLNT
jgi:hypothetical protein